MMHRVFYSITEWDKSESETDSRDEALLAFREGKQVTKTTRVRVEADNTTSYFIVITEVKKRKEI